MALIFPASPLDGDIYNDATTGRRFKYISSFSAWEPQGGDSAPVFFTSKPVEPKQGQVYYDVTTETLEVYSETTASWEKVEAPSTALWEVTANGTTDYIFSGAGFAGTELDPTITVIRGQTYTITNATGAHPFQIQATQGLGGMPYADGVTNNGVSNGTLTWEVRMDAPDTLYYQCTTHAAMGGTINVLNAGGAVALANFNTAGTVYGLVEDDNNNYHTFLGWGAGNTTVQADGSYCTFIGQEAGKDATDAAHCTFVGYWSGYGTTTGTNNIGLGGYTCSVNTGSNNIAIGYATLGAASGSSNNTGLGNNSLANTVGSNNTAVGYQALVGNVGSGNTVVGSYNASNVAFNNHLVLAKTGTVSNRVLSFNEDNAMGVATWNSASLNNAATRNAVDYGTAGDVLVSQGATAPPQWTTGASGSFTAGAQTVTVTNGIITSIV